MAIKFLSASVASTNYSAITAPTFVIPFIPKFFRIVTAPGSTLAMRVSFDGVGDDGRVDLGVTPKTFIQQVTNVWVKQETGGGAQTVYLEAEA